MAHWTRRQRQIMQEVMIAESRGKPIDIDELMRLLRIGASKQAAQCSIRILEERGVLLRAYESRRGRRRMVLTGSTLAASEFSYFVPATP